MINDDQFLNFYQSVITSVYTVEPFLRGHPDERPTPLERPLDTVNLNINVLISIPEEFGLVWFNPL